MLFRNISKLGLGPHGGRYLTDPRNCDRYLFSARETVTPKILPAHSGSSTKLYLDR